MFHAYWLCVLIADKIIVMDRRTDSHTSDDDSLSESEPILVDHPRYFRYDIHRVQEVFWQGVGKDEQWAYHTRQTVLMATGANQLKWC